MSLGPRRNRSSSASGERADLHHPARAAGRKAGTEVTRRNIRIVRAAIAENRYPVDADKIAQAMIDLDLPRGA